MNATLSPPGDQLGEPLYPGPELRGLASGPRPGSTRPSVGGRGLMGSSSAGCAQPESRAAAHAATRKVSARGLHRIAAGRAGDRLRRQLDQEGGAQADLALHGDVAAVHIDYLLAYGQAEPATPCRPRAVLVYPVEAPEELVEVFRWDAYARVLYANRSPGRGVFHRDVHPVARVRVLDGVVEQVEEDLVELLNVADAAVLGLVLEVHLDAEALGLGLDGPDGGPHHLPEVSGADLELVLPRVHLGQRHQLLDHGPDARELPLGELQGAVLQRVEPLPRPLKQADGALNGSERRP